MHSERCTVQNYREAPQVYSVPKMWKLCAKMLVVLHTRTHLQQHSGLACLEIRSRNEEPINYAG